MKPTLQTVADAVGVSRSTVSNAYGRPDQLSAELRERIFEVAGKLGYPGPNPAARSLRRGSAGAIGVLFTASLSYAFVDPYAVLFLRGLAEVAQRHETGLLLLPLSPDDDEASEHAVRNAVADGFCVYCVPEWHGSLNVIRSRGLPIVTAEFRSDAAPEDILVGVDERAAFRSAAEHLARLGHRRIAIVSEDLSKAPSTGVATLGSPDDVPDFAGRERLHGAREAFEAVGVPWEDILVVHTAANTRANGAAAAAYALDRADRPTAIMGVTDLFALGALDAMAARGLRPGVDVSVTGFDDIPEAAAAKLTTVRQPSVRKGEIAGELLLDPPADPADRQVELPTELVVRATTGPVVRR